MNVFLDRISAVLESPVTEETKFREVDGWSSLMVFGLLVTLENDYGKRIDIAELSKYETVGD
jgi:acyl carrier protein